MFHFYMIVFYVSDMFQVKSWKLTGEGEEVVQSGSHEARLFNLVPAADGGIEQAMLMGLCGKWGKIGFSKAMSAGWISIDKSQVLYCVKIIPQFEFFRPYIHLNELFSCQFKIIDTCYGKYYSSYRLLL